MLKNSLLAVLFFTCAFAKAQSYTITGTLKDKTTQESLEAATVFLETVRDSTLLTYTISNGAGAFELKTRTKLKEARVNISFVGFADYSKKITLDTEDIDLGTIELEESAAMLNEVVLKSRSPVTVKKDTLEFNVSSFKTKKDATVEDLLKELPGVEVDEDGKILVNGKEVSQILVNGKPFFSDDPTIATRNLTKDIIEKIQVVDTKTTDEAFSGEEGDQENKTINLTIKEENNKGTFGRLSAGGGTDSRFEYAGIINRFDNDRRISVLGGGNNINSPGFSFGEIQKMFGSGGSISYNSNGNFSIGGRRFGGGEGIVNSRTAGANYADVIGENIDVNGDYFYSGSNSNNESRVERENILPDRRFFTSRNSKTFNNTDSHDVNTSFEYKVDSTLFLTVRPSFTRVDSRNEFEGSETSRDSDGNLINSSTSSNIDETTANNFKNEINATKKWGDKGSFFRFNVENTIERQDSRERVQSEALIFSDPDVVSDRTLRDQTSDGDQTLDGLYVSGTLRQPLIAKKLFVDFGLNYRNDRRENKRSTFNFDETTQDFTLFQEALSTDFTFKNTRLTPSLNLAYNGEKLNMSFRTSYVFRTLENSDALRSELSASRDFEAVELNSNMNYRFSTKASMYMGYSLSNAPPQLSQLNPFVDVSNPLNTVVGNPDLEPTNRHSLYVGFNNFDFQNGGGFYSYFNFNSSTDDVVTRSTINDDLTRTTTFENVDGNYGVSGSLGYDKKVKIDSVKTVTFRMGLYGNGNRRTNFNNDVQYESINNTVSPNVGVTFDWKKVLTIAPRYTFSYSRNTFDLDLFEDQTFRRHSLNTRINVIGIKNIEWRNDVNYTYNPDVAPGFDQNVLFWNSTVSYSFAKDRAQLSLKIYDVLGQNNNAQRTATADYIQDSQSTVLQRYGMLSFSWKFNTLGSKGETGNGGMFFF